MFEKFRLFRQEPATMKMDEVPLFLLGKFEREKRDVENKLFSSCTDIKSQFEEMKKTVSALKAKSFDNTFANTVKDRFCDKSEDAINALPAFLSTYESLCSYVSASLEAVQKIGGINLKEFRHLHAFRDDMAKIAESIKLLEAEINFSQKLISNSILKGVYEIKSFVEGINEKQKSILSIDAEIGELRSSLANLEALIKAKESEISALNEKFSRHAEERLKMREMEKSMSAVRQRIGNEFSGLDRTMKKFLYFGDMAKEDAGVLKRYLKDPGDAFLEDENNAIKGILESMHAFHDRELIELDDKRLEKLLDLLRHFKVLVELKQQYHILKGEKEFAENALESKTGPILKEIKNAKADCDNLRNETGRIESRIRAKESEKRAAEGEILEKKNEMEMKLSRILNRDVRLA